MSKKKQSMAKSRKSIGLLCILMVLCCRIMAFPLADNDSISYFFDHGNYSQAKILAEQNIQTAGAINDWNVVLQNYEILIAIDSITHNFHSAFIHLKEKEKIAQKLLVIQKDKIMNDNIQYQNIETTSLQIANMEEKLLNTERNIHLCMNLIVVTTVVLCFLLVIIFVQIFLFQRNKRLISTLQIENNQKKHQLEDITRLVHQYDDNNQQLIHNNIQLETTNAVKDKLLSVISHDLRSPISSLQALLNLFSSNNIARTDLVSFFGNLLSRVENTSTMLENLLHWSHYQLKGIEPIFHKIDLQKIIDECIHLYRMQAEQKHIVIDNTLKTNVYVLADVEMLKVILRNLISNALKFTHSGGIITIMTMTKENYAIISVKDTGVGISPENQEKMFAMDNFTTLGTENEKGTGLGLMLCKDFVEHNNGKIWLDSKINVGTTFHFSIPISDG